MKGPSSPVVYRTSVWSRTAMNAVALHHLSTVDTTTPADSARIPLRFGAPLPCRVEDPVTVRPLGLSRLYPT